VKKRMVAGQVRVLYRDAKYVNTRTHVLNAPYSVFFTELSLSLSLSLRKIESESEATVVMIINNKILFCFFINQ
jgi:hypothetical protein